MRRGLLLDNIFHSCQSERLQSKMTYKPSTVKFTEKHLDVSKNIS